MATTSGVNGSNLMSQLGAGSGVDTKTLAESLVSAEKQPQADAINGRITKTQSRISGLSAVMLSMDTLRTAFKAVDDPSDFNALSISNTNTSALSATSTAGKVAVTGSRSIEISQLASAQRNISGGFAASDTSLNGGKAFSLRLSVNGGAASSIRVTAANATPGGMVAAINKANLGVTAQLVNTNDGSATPFKIILNGTSGASNAFTMTSDDGNGLGEQQQLSFTAATTSGNISVQGVLVGVTAGDSAGTVAAKVKAALDANTFITGTSGRSTSVSADGSLLITYAGADGDVSAPAWGDVGATGVTANYATTRAPGSSVGVSGVDFSSRTASALDAVFKVDGLQLKRSSNVISDAISGVTLSLTGTTTSAATLDLKRDTTKIKTNVQGLVKAFNDALSDFKILGGEKNKKDETDVYSGSLQNDATLSMLKSQLRSMFTDNSSTPGSTVKAMRDIGVTIQKDGTLELDETKFDAALASNFTDIVTMLTADKESKGTTGTAKRGLAGDAVKRLSDMMGSTGLIMNQTTSSNTQLARYKNDLTKLETRMETVLARYTAMFANMDKIVGNANSMKTYLTNQFKAMSGSGG